MVQTSLNCYTNDQPRSADYSLTGVCADAFRSGSKQEANKSSMAVLRIASEVRVVIKRSMASKLMGMDRCAMSGLEGRYAFRWF